MARLLRCGRARLLVVALLLPVLQGGTPTAQSRASKNFLWSVHSGPRVLYLAGSVHALGPSAYPLNPAFQRAFDASGTLVEEIDLNTSFDPATAPALLLRGMYLDGRTFDQVVSKETTAMVAERITGTSLSMPLLRPMKPWMVMVMLTALEIEKAGLDASLGLDRHFFDKAVAAGKPVIGLETAESQIDRLDKMPDAVQEQMLRSTLEQIETTSKELKDLVSAWQRGDARAMEDVLLDAFEDYPAAYASLIVERNHNWMPQLEKCLASTAPCFVVVGAAHLVGKDGLLALLRAKGYRIEQM